MSTEKKSETSKAQSKAYSLGLVKTFTNVAAFSKALALAARSMSGASLL